jgi:hypothetical protein
VEVVLQCIYAILIRTLQVGLPKGHHTYLAAGLVEQPAQRACLSSLFFNDIYFGVLRVINCSRRESWLLASLTFVDRPAAAVHWQAAVWLKPSYSRRRNCAGVSEVRDKTKKEPLIHPSKLCTPSRLSDTLLGRCAANSPPSPRPCRCRRS